MSNNITKLSDPMEKVISDMTGPKRSGHDVIIDGRAVPGLIMRDRGDEIEFVLDGRYSFSFPRGWAYLAASFASTAMAIGAGHPSASAPHKSTKAFAPRCVNIADFDPDQTA